MGAPLPVIAVVTRSTRMQGLKQRWVTAKNAAFRMNFAAEHEVERRKERALQLGSFFDFPGEMQRAEALADDDDLMLEDANYQSGVENLMQELDLSFPLKNVQRKFITNFDFGRCVAVVVIGQDGLVANTAKYVGDLPIIGVNPDPLRNDGILLPFQINGARRALQRVLNNRYQSRKVTLAEVNTNDGQRMLAFNDFFLGSKSHVSARYTLELDYQTESQSSSGLLISTGAGSTGWMSSVMNMARGIGAMFGTSVDPMVNLKWEDRKLLWAVREPFVSRHSSADFVMGYLDDAKELVVGSQMDRNGVIFSDGVESDFIEFNAGTIARFSVSAQSANLVVG